MLTEETRTGHAAMPFRFICMPENGKTRGGHHSQPATILAALSPRREAGSCEASVSVQLLIADAPGPGWPASSFFATRFIANRFTANFNEIISIRIHNKTKVFDNHRRIICLPNSSRPPTPLCPLDSYACREKAKTQGGTPAKERHGPEKPRLTR